MAETKEVKWPLCPKCKVPLVKSEYKTQPNDLQCKKCGRLYDPKTVS